MEKKADTPVVVLFVIRVFLWIVALVSTVYWIYYSNKLHSMGIFAPEEYSPLMRPVLYTCLAISIAAICISFVLHALSKKMKSRQ